MSFIFAWIISTVAVFGVELILMLIEKLLGGVIPFFSTEISISKIRWMIVFSVISGFILAIT